MSTRFMSSVAFVVCLVWVSANSSLNSHSQESHADADIDFLASDAHLVVGDVSLVVPFVALTGYVANKPSFSLNRQQERLAAENRLDAFRKAAINPQTAPIIDKLEVSVDSYGWDDVNPPSKLCARLSRRWSKSVCDEPWAPLRQAMPMHPFFLVDDRKFDAFKNHWTLGGERMSDHLRSMRLNAHETSVVCDRATSSNTKNCTAAISIENHLVAVWTVWDSTKETHSRQAEREGKAIKAFVLHAIGQSENFPILLSTACELRNPMSSVGPAGSPCDRSPTPKSR